MFFIEIAWVDVILDDSNSNIAASISRLRLQRHNRAHIPLFRHSHRNQSGFASSNRPLWLRNASGFSRLIFSTSC